MSSPKRQRVCYADLWVMCVYGDDNMRNIWGVFSELVRCPPPPVGRRAAFYGDPCWAQRRLAVVSSIGGPVTRLHPQVDQETQGERESSVRGVPAG